jgi:hypothetical protein
MRNVRILFIVPLFTLIQIKEVGSEAKLNDLDNTKTLQNREIAHQIKDKVEKPVIMVPYSLNWENSKDSKLNFSFLLDKPAGKSGFIIVKDGHFVKPSGERFRMWGVNLTGAACFPDKKDAPLVAAFLARFGINVVRLHFLDSNWGQERSLFNSDLNTTRELFAPQLDKLDYFISELKKAGVYSDINLNVGRTYRKDDGVPEYEYLGFAKAVTLFDDHIIELQKEYAKQLLTHVNPYTGNSYINEPAIAEVEIVNENSLVEAWFGSRLLGKKTTTVNTTWMDIPPYYGKELTIKYNNWLKKNLGAADIEKIENEAGVKPGEEIPRLTPKEFKAASALRFHAESEFIISTERKFFTGMYDYLKNELKVRSLIAANSDHNHYNSGYALLSSTSLLDVADGHVYWQHPSERVDQKTGTRYSVIENTPMVNNPRNSTVVQLSRSAVEGKPYTISETNHPFPNEYACEGIPILGAYALLQDWDGIFYYTLEHVAPQLWNTNYSGSFGMGLDPVKMPEMAAIGLMYLRGDLKAAETCVYRGYTKNDIIEGIRETSDNRPYFTQGFSPLTPLIEQTRIRSFDSKTGEYPVIGEESIIRAGTGEISWSTDKGGFVEIAAPKTESLIGFIPESASLLKHLKVNIENEFAAITLISIDDKPLASAEKLLLTATGKTGMTGMKWSDDRKRLIEPGTKPTTIEVIKGELGITGLGNAKSIIIEPLDGGGNPLKSISKPVKNGTAKFDIGNDVTVWYYLTVER